MSLRKAVGHTVILEKNELGLGFGLSGHAYLVCVRPWGSLDWAFRRWREEREVKEEAEEEFLKQGDPPFFCLTAYLFLES